MVKNKRIIIAGGSSGIGLLTAEMLLNEGAEVIIVGRNKDKLQNDIKLYNVSPQSAAVDFSDRARVNLFFQNMGMFDHLIIAVSGGKGAGLFKDLDLADLRSGFEGKFWPQLTCLQAALP